MSASQAPAARTLSASQHLDALIESAINYYERDARRPLTDREVELFDNARAHLAVTPGVNPSARQVSEGVAIKLRFEDELSNAEFTPGRRHFAGNAGLGSVLAHLQYEGTDASAMHNPSGLVLADLSTLEFEHVMTPRAVPRLFSKTRMGCELDEPGQSFSNLVKL